MRVLPMAAVVVTLCACASASTPDPAIVRPASQSVELGSPGARLTVAPSEGPVSKSVPAAVNDVWRVLPAVFDSLAIPVVTLDPAKRMLGGENTKVRQRLGKVPLSRYLDCGQTQIGPNADSYEIFLTLFAQAVQGANNTTTLAVTLDAYARPIAFAQAPSHCSSKGLLESRIVEVATGLARR